MVDFLRSLERALENEKPGLEAQLTMCTEPRPGTRAVHGNNDSPLKAGVLVLLYPVVDQLYLVFTRRTDRVFSHQGQISFPGGRKEPEEDIQAAALREIHEELGLSTESIRILKSLTPLYIPRSGFCVYPYVAFSAERPEFHPSPDEVAEVIEVPLQHLRDSHNIRKENRIIGGMKMVVPFYSFRDHKIWGATAMVLAEFLAIVEMVEKNGKLV